MKHPLILLCFSVLSCLLFLTTSQVARALERPAIPSSAGGKNRVPDNASNSAAENPIKVDQDLAALIKTHKEDPAKSLENAPKMGMTGVHGHINWLKEAVRAGTLYFKTGNEDYAQFAADRLNHYMQFLGAKKEVEAVVSSDGRSRDYRDVHQLIAFTYDYIQPFLIKHGTTVFDAVAGKRIPFDNDKAQLMFRNIVEYGIKVTAGGTNLTITETSGVLYPALCIEDKKQRDAYVKACVEGWGKKTGVLWMKKVLIENNGIWPESATYSGVGVIVPHYMEVIDRLYPEYKIFGGFEGALNGVLNRLLFDYPNGAERVCFGDSHRRAVPWQIPEDYIRIARQAGFEDVAKRFSAQIQAGREKPAEKPSAPGKAPLEGYEAKPAANYAVHLPYAGIIIQKNVDVPDPKLNGMMYYTGGANYIHSHQSGLDMELYGAGVVMGGVASELAGVGSRGSDIYVDYYRIYAGHNTVVINGKSVGANKGWKGYFSGWMDPVMLQAAEPMPNTPFLSKDFTFSIQILDDKVNKAEQQRIVSIVRTSDTSGYYFDLFRSRSKGKNEFHDYIYHNIGEGLTLTSGKGSALTLNPAKDRYQTSVTVPGTTRRAIPFPGWKSFSNVATSPLTAATILGTFNIDLKPNRRSEPNIPAGKRYMHVAMPGGNEREYTSAEAPPILEAAGGYEKKNARILSIRQPGEAWDRPFIVVFEPSINEVPTVQSVENIINQNKVVGAKVVSKVGDSLITDWIIAQENDKATLDDQTSRIQFRGRFAIVRTVKTGENTKVSLYIGDGSQLSFGANTLSPPANQTAAFRTF